MKLARKISMLDRLVSDLKADVRDPFEHLDTRELAALRDYQSNTEPMQQYIDVMDGKNPTAALLNSVGLNADCTEMEAREAYERELVSFGKWYKRRVILKGIRTNA